MIKFGRGGSLLRPPSSKSGLRKGERGSVPWDLIPPGVCFEEGLSVRLHPPRCRGIIVVSTTPSLQRPITQTHERGGSPDWAAGPLPICASCLSASSSSWRSRRHGGAGYLRASGGEEAVLSGRAVQRQPVGPGPHDPGPGVRRPELHRAAGGRPRQPGRSGDRPAGADRPQPGHDPAEGRSPNQRRHHSAAGVLDLAGRPDGRPAGRRQRRCQHDGPGLGGGLARAQTVVCHADRARVAARSNEARCVRSESPDGHSSSA